MCQLMRYGVDSEEFHHVAVVFWQDGVCCVTEAHLGRPLLPVPLTQWVIERQGQLVAVQPRQIAHEKFYRHFGLRYDKAAAFSMLHLRRTGEWNGRTGEASATKIFCLEYAARLLDMENPFCMTMPPLLSSAKLLTL